MPSLADANYIRRVATLQVSCHDFLVDVFQRAVAQGLIHPNELILAGHTWGQLNNAQDVQLVPQVSPTAEPPAALSLEESTSSEQPQ